jgi:hypothetical protein
LTFAHRLLADTKLLILNTLLAAVLLRLEQSEILVSALAPGSETIPPEIGFRVDPSFFERESCPPHLAFQLASLESSVEQMTLDISHLEAPIWSSDFDFFMDNLIERATGHIEKSLSYVQPVPEEVDLSRYLFSGGNPVLCDEVDESIRSFVPDDPPRFLHWLIDFASRLIPNYLDRPAAEQSIGLMAIFRVVFDRLYEKMKRIGRPHPFDEQNLLWRLAVVPARLYEFPLEKRSEEDLNVPVREYFARQHFFHSAALFLNEILYVTNPVDALYFVHRALRLIHKAALLKKLGPTGEATTHDIKRLLGFDDLFAYLIGVVLATDLPDFFSAADFIEAYSPRNCLSNSFEFAHAAISALLMHFRSLDVEQMEAQADPSSHF